MDPPQDDLATVALCLTLLIIGGVAFYLAHA